MNTSLTSADIERIFQKQSEHQWKQKKTTMEERVALLQKMKASILSHADEIKAALYADLQKPVDDAQADVDLCCMDIDETIENLSGWMAPREMEPSAHMAGTKPVLTYESRGIVLLFGPWNYPFSLIFQPLVPILAAGNCAMVKPNEMAPETSKVSSKIIREVFDEELVAAFEGGVDLANELLEVPVSHVFFTGSPAVGRVVMAAAAKHLATVTLELGGKNPVIIDRNADLANAASIIATMRNVNNGQVCLCPENIWVPEEKKEEFLQVAKATFESVYYADGEVNPAATARIIDERNLKRVTGYLNDAAEKGATVYCGGGFDEDSRRVQPTILADIPRNANILQEETFGPILSVFTYKTMDDVYDALHADPKPLALYVFSESQGFIDDVLANTSSGGVSVNTCVMHYMESKLPFGGVNASGIGRYHGVHGFRELSHERAVLITDVERIQA